MYEALLREGMDAEQSDEFDLQLEEASLMDDDALAPIEKRDLMLLWGGQVVTD